MRSAGPPCTSRSPRASSPRCVRSDLWGTTSARRSTRCCAATASITDDIEHVEGGKTFFWSGEYEWDLNTAHTLDTQLNVFGDFAPKLSDASRDCDLLFLANIQPDLQRDVREQCTGAQLAALDSMNFWIESTRESLLKTISGVDMVLMNDAELRMLTEEPNLVRAAARGSGDGPARGDRQAGRVRRRAVHARTASSRCPPTRSRRSATRPARATRSPAA